jgi:hypothetical protein
MRWRYPVILFAVSVGFFVAGLAYGVVMVGVPTQDPTPALAAVEAGAASISGWGMGAGACLFLASLAWFAVLWIAKLVRRTSVV